MDLQCKQYLGEWHQVEKEMFDVGTYYISIFQNAELYKKETMKKKKDS